MSTTTGATTESGAGTEQKIGTLPFHEWILKHLESGVLSLHLPAAGIRDLLVEISIPAKHDEIAAAFKEYARKRGFVDDRGLAAKLYAEKVRAEEKARQKAAAGEK